MKKLLVANRGEIAVRIIRAARSLGIATVAVYSDADAGSLPVRLADQRVALAGNKARDTYLDIDKLVAAAVMTGADAVHPGYGFLAENARFAGAVEEAGLTFVGPKPDVIALMGDKECARQAAIAHGVPTVPGHAPTPDRRTLKEAADGIGYPVLLKAVAGGSGRGMRVVERPADLDCLFDEASAEALSAFSKGELLLEKYIQRPRHIEVQVFGDNHGNVVHFYERECSVQRRHQKLIEEAPAPNLHPGVRERMLGASLALAKGVGYSGSGTMEFLVVDGTKEGSPFYFIEMNTRIQVEHPVTEEVTGADLVRLQLEVAAGGTLPRQESINCRGSALEFRLYAEDPTANFSPALGTVTYLSRPGGPGVREDGWAEAGTTISPYYDSLLSKLIVRGESREVAVGRARRVLGEYLCEGLPTTLGFHRWILTQPDFENGNVYVTWIADHYRGEQLETEAGSGPLTLPPSR